MSTIYMKYGNIKGDATEAKHKEWLNINSINFSMNRNVTTRAGQVSNRDKGTVNMNDLVVTKSVDKSTPELLGKACAGASSDKCTIDLLQVEDKTAKVYMQYVLEDCIITSYSIDSVSAMEPTEVFTINFSKLSVEYTPHDKSNKAQGPTSAFYDPTEVISG